METIHVNLQNKRIFIVDDNPANIAAAKTILEWHGANVWFDRWGDKMLDRLESFLPVDIILMDLMFPNGITGYELFDQIRARPSLANIPVVAVSASDAAASVNKTRTKGFAGYIAKPVNFDYFAQQIAQILAGEAVWLV